jgi:hypothetical protein
MIYLPKLLLIGGNTRNIGKTTFACAVIRKFSAFHDISAFKLTSIYKNDDKHHGNHELLQNAAWEISRETLSSKPKDTARMLAAGATASYYVQALDHAIELAWSEFAPMTPDNHLLLCESRSLRRFVEPGVFIYLKSSRVIEEKPYSIWLESKASLVLTDPSHETLEKALNNLSVSMNTWKL